VLELRRWVPLLKPLARHLQGQALVEFFLQFQLMLEPRVPAGTALRLAERLASMVAGGVPA